ncbi:hypothetical protein [Actinomycetospora chiangmaiensis]|uniref:hypothetical protein n=1 Tax=Actinomycetospora chiangmaiensis TaxID=402650 RepID=UPI0003674392|nr:hypothetical protein [Actinomycetospora chiangmaiensis]
MTDVMPPAPDLPPLLTDDDVLDRVESLVGTAREDRTLWLVPLDGDRRQPPLLIPIQDVPYLPGDLVAGLGTVIAGFLPGLSTAAGPGSVVFVLERFGPATVHPADRDWAEALVAMCEARGVVQRGVFTATSAGVVRLV